MFPAMQRLNPQHRYKKKSDQKARQALDIIQRLRIKKQNRKQQQLASLSKQLTPKFNTLNQLTLQTQQNFLDDLYFQIFQKHSLQNKSDTYKTIVYQINKLKSQEDKENQNQTQILIGELKILQDGFNRFKQQTFQDKKNMEKIFHDKQMLLINAQSITIQKTLQQKNKQIKQLVSSAQIQIQKRQSQADKFKQQLTKQYFFINNYKQQNQSLKHKIQQNNLNEQFLLQRVQIFNQIEQQYKNQMIYMTKDNLSLKQIINKLQTQIFELKHESNKNSQADNFYIKQIQLLKFNNSSLASQLSTIKQKSYDLIKQIKEIKTLQYKNQSIYQSSLLSYKQKLDRSIKDMQNQAKQLSQQKLIKLKYQQQNKQNITLLYSTKKQICLLQQQLIEQKMLNSSLKKQLQTIQSQFSLKKQTQSLNEQIKQDYQIKLSIQIKSFQRLKQQFIKLQQKYKVSCTKIEEVQKQRQQQLQAFQITINNFEKQMKLQKQGNDHQINLLNQQITLLKNTKHTKNQLNNINSQLQALIQKQRVKYASNSRHLYQEIQTLNNQIQQLKKQLQTKDQQIKLNSIDFEQQNKKYIELKKQLSITKQKENSKYQQNEQQQQKQQEKQKQKGLQMIKHKKLIQTIQQLTSELQIAYEQINYLKQNNQQNGSILLEIEQQNKVEIKQSNDNNIFTSKQQKANVSSHQNKLINDNIKVKQASKQKKNSSINKFKGYFGF